MAKHNRKKLFIDFKVQGSLILRGVSYWAFCLLAITMMLFFWKVLTGPSKLFSTHAEELWRNLGPAFFAATLMLPIVLFDMLRLSHRFAGPIYRIRGAMQRLARGETVAPIHLRDGDFWQDFADEFNVLAAKVEARKKPCGKAAGGGSPACATAAPQSIALETETELTPAATSSV